MAAVSALMLSPLVIPYIVFGISLLLFFHAISFPLSFASLAIAHIVLSVPYTILVLVPRLEQIDSSLEEAARDLGASRLRTFRSIVLPLILPAVVSAFLIALVVSFDEYAVASFVAGQQTTFPIYLYGALRFPSRLPEVIAVAVVVMTVSLIVVVGAEIGRRHAEGRLGDLELSESIKSCWELTGGAEARIAVWSTGQVSTTCVPPVYAESAFVREPVAKDRACGGLDLELGEHAEVDDLGDLAGEAGAILRWRGRDRVDADLLGADGRRGSRRLRGCRSRPQRRCARRRRNVPRPGCRRSRPRRPRARSASR